MRLQHPEKRQFEIAPAGADPVLTDERGIAEVPNDVGNSLLEQGWTRLKDNVKTPSGDPEPVAPAVENTEGVDDASEEK